MVRHWHAKLQGITLVELMIVLAVISILVAVGYPLYTDYVYKARRADAKAVLLESAQFMERYYTENMSYSGAALPTALQTAPRSYDASRAFYTVSVNSASATAFTLTATPTAKQTADDCGTMTIDQTGATTPTTPDYCW
ncbi:type IV pilin protein [Solemya velesiana gill symbiont]|uniref:Pilus assembly protein PilE n=1 Tax=Solemya velesiana gill symbiont TaxID=1918948 RepID=A0A1T2KQ86_9GAMM|nr:type IV pilin protein [Solemya velesiana gill symbiont]OOZ34951.1 hypothetical protein BOW51_11760 [Solemya velesiana gill symbiont]